MEEYRHRCAKCGADKPHLHHIDEDPSNNDPMNLIPLCPNCHLNDQHNPTSRIEIGKLHLFRAHKDPLILDARFHPIYVRQQFLDAVNSGDDVDNLGARAYELIEFVQSFEKGDFYAKQLKSLIREPFFVMVLGDGIDNSRQREDYQRAYVKRLRDNRTMVQALLVELIRYQGWN
jgi:hypothetical protein